MSELGRPNRRPSMMSAKQALSLASGIGSASSAAYRYATTGLGQANQRLVSKAIQLSHEQRTIELQGNSNLSNTASPLQMLLNATTQGVTGSSRSGRKFKMERLQLSLNLQISVNAAYGDIIRVVIFIDKECRGNQPTAADYFQDNTFGVRQVLSPVLFDNLPRFIYLHDQVYNLNPMTQNAAVITANNLTLRIDKPLNQVVSCYNTSTGTIADIEKNAMYAFVCGTAPTTLTSCYYYSRVTFRDL